MIILNLLIIIIGSYNIDTSWGKLLIAGEVSNIIAVSTNEWKMPVSGDNYSTFDNNHTLITSKTNFPIFCDWLNVNIPSQGNLYFSPGDLTITISAIIALYEMIFLNE